MKKLFILVLLSFFFTACAGLMQPTPELDQSLEELLEQAEGAGYDSTMTGAEVQAELDRCDGRNLTVGDPGSDAELVTEQAVREALNAKQGTLTNEAGLYSALSDVTDFVQPGEDTDIGAFTLTALKFTSDQATGTAPLTVASTTVVTNLNADTLDGEEAIAFEDADTAITKTDEAETITANWVNTANPWADNEVANSLTLDLLLMSALTAAPGSPAAGVIYYADNDTWDPSDIAGTDNYYCMYDGADYIAIINEDGAFLFRPLNSRLIHILRRVTQHITTLRPRMYLLQPKSKMELLPMLGLQKTGFTHAWRLNLALILWFK